MKLPAPPWTPPDAPHVEAYDIRVITPMFGGGYEPGNVDADTVIRPASVRGHLRFWWRATAGAKFMSSKALFEAEEDLWGSDKVPGKVAISVKDIASGDAAKCGEYERDHRDPSRFRALPTFCVGWPPYALQAFQGELADKRTRVAKDPATARTGVGFGIVLYLADASRADQVHGALTAWITYGGIGARTRRGCGSLACSGIGPSWNTADVAGSEEITSLHGAVAVWGRHGRNAEDAWRRAVEVYQMFRQGEGVARTDRTKKASGADDKTPGRSWWPEPDSVRRIRDTWSDMHKPVHAVQSSFPRADLGLPIIFHFKDHDEKRQGSAPNDPADATLSGPSEGMNRFASPVITKAVATKDGFRPLVLMLKAPHVWRFGPIRLGEQDLVHREQIELSAPERSATKPLAGQDVREALIRHVERAWGTQREILL